MAINVIATTTALTADQNHSDPGPISTRLSRLMSFTRPSTRSYDDERTVDAG